MSPKVLSMLNNVKTFLSPDEVRELAFALEKDFGKVEKQTKKDDPLKDWTVESVTERLLATYFNKKRKR